MEVIVIGNEVTSGLIEEKNSRYIGRRAMQLGWECTRVTSIGDDAKTITECLGESLSRVDWIVLTGGLGATHDDITKKVLADLFECGWKSDAKVKKMLERLFHIRGKEVPHYAYSQTEVPDEAEVLYNEKGTAPGLLFKRNNQHVFALPGVPLEMEYLFEKYIVPSLEGSGKHKICHRMLHTAGITESALWQKFGPVDPLERWVKVASLPSHLGVKIRLSAEGEEDSDIWHRLDQAESLLRESVGHYIFGVDGETLEYVAGVLLKSRNENLAVAESCTGGLIGSRLTNISGSSSYFLEGMITYSNQAKIQRLGVPANLIGQHGAVSQQVAEAMAQGIRQVSGAHWGVAVTGIAGPTGGTPDKPVGLTYIAVSGADKTHAEKFLFHQDRVRNKERAAQAALNMLRLRLLEAS